MSLLQRLAVESIWPAPAKINLFLHIIRQRVDGYHELQTLFQFLDYGDVLQFSVRSDSKINRMTPNLHLTPEQDLVVRAAKCLQQSSGVNKGADIFLEKTIPMGGGLGGGSSDAATVLVALNILWDIQYPRSKLAQLGLTLGADVPVFVEAMAAWAEGVGERLTPARLEEAWYVVVCPGVSVSTIELFASPDLTRDSQPIKIRDYFEGATCNVFEPLVTRKYPVVAGALKWLSNATGTTARMSGTGSCIFAIVEDERQATEVVAAVPEEWHCFKARGLNESPLNVKCLNIKNKR